MFCTLIVAIVALFTSATRSARLSRRVRRFEKIADGGFLLALSGLFAKVAMADGKVTADEVKTVEDVFAKMGLSHAERATCVGNFMLAQRGPDDACEVARSLNSSLNHVACLFLYGLLWRVAKADGHVSEGEERLLTKVGEALGVEADLADAFRAGEIPPLDQKALDDAGVPASLVRLARAGR